MNWLAVALFLSVSATGLSQVVTEFPIPTAASKPTLIAAGPDGNLWFTEYDANQIGRITTAGVITEFPLPTAGSQPWGITAGPDHAIWFTEYGGNRIGRITIAGVITEFALPTPSRGVRGIVSGPDGALWFTEVPMTVGRITTDGVVTEIPIGPYFTMSSIAGGPDGNLWAGPANQGILRITTAGDVARFPVSVMLDLTGVAAGPDGDIWFVRKLGTQAIVYENLIERVTTGGVSDGNVVISSEPGQLGGIAAGPDGNMWSTAARFTGIDSIVRTAPDLTTTEFPIPSPHGAPIGIAAGSDGALWFAERDGNAIGRITTGTAISGASLVPIGPCRIGDTRVPGGVMGTVLTSNRTRTISVAGPCGVPASARAIAVNVTLTRSTSDGHLVLFAGVGNGPIPQTSTVNYVAGQTRANNAVLPLGPGLTFSLFCGQPFGSTDAVVDVTGYFQ